MRQLLAALVVLALVVGSVQQARAEPTLQIYLEGGTYDPISESWVLTATDSSPNQTFRLWAIANGSVLDVRLAVAYDETFPSLEIDLDNGQTLLDDTTDPAFPYELPERPVDPDDPLPIPSYSRVIDYGDGHVKPLNSVETSEGLWEAGAVVTNGSRPVLSDGNALEPHGVYGEETHWKEFYLGHFDSMDSPVGDFYEEFPTSFKEEAGQINVYEVTVSNGFGATLHFDLFNHLESRNKARFAPYSHSGDVNTVPAPPAYVGLISMALMGLGGYVWRKRRGC